MDISNLIKDKDGLIKTGPSSSINPNNLSENGYKMALSYAQSQGAVPIASEGATPTDTTQEGGLVGFKDVLSKVVNLAKEKRNASSLGFMAPFRGTVMASDFNSILGNLNKASDTFAQDQITNAQDQGKLTTETVGNFEVLKDASGKVISTRAISSGGNDYDKALKFVQDNPDASPQELEQAIRSQAGDLSESDIQSLVGGTKLTRENMASLFGISDDETIVGGFLGIGGSTGKEKLNEIMASIKKYQDVGYNDTEILKLMKE